jgi:hypothetical protein
MEPLLALPIIVQQAGVVELLLLEVMPLHRLQETVAMELRLPFQAHQ